MPDKTIEQLEKEFMELNPEATKHPTQDRFFGFGVEEKFKKFCEEKLAKDKEINK